MRTVSAVRLSRRLFLGGSVSAVALNATRSASAQDIEIDLSQVKSYVVSEAAAMKKGTEELRTIAGRYFDLASQSSFDYATMLETNAMEVPGLIAAAKKAWLTASTHYELNEGLIAGVPSLSHFDVIIDAGPSGEEDPAGALDWTLELPDGTVLEKPGNYFHSLLEPSIWGTTPAFVGLKVDIDGDGDIGVGDVLPEANLFKAAADGLDDATAEMQAAVDEWDPTVEDAFAALVTMIPTMGEYFEQWKLSAFVTGEETTDETAFVATSRLFDVNGIVHGLDVTYDIVRPLVAHVDAALDTRIETEFADLVAFVEDLYSQESEGKRFTPDEAELYGSEAQERAATLVGYVSQAVGLLNLAV